MKTIIATKEVLNRHGDVIKIVYHYEDGTKSEKNIFISASEIARMNKFACRMKYPHGRKK
jgi:hypothetical protein